MRITGGRLRGRRLATPSWAGLRPTSDGLRETMFNIIGSRVQGARVLDAFAGTGALGLEAVSRGASSVTFVDSDRRALVLVTRNVDRCGVGEACAIIRADASRGPHLSVAPFDLVLADPPYEGADLGPVVAALGGLLADGGLLVLEHATRRPVPLRVGAVVRVRQVVSGDSALALYECRPATEDAPGIPDAH